MDELIRIQGLFPLNGGPIRFSSMAGRFFTVEKTHVVAFDRGAHSWLLVEVWIEPSRSELQQRRSVYITKKLYVGFCPLRPIYF